VFIPATELNGGISSLIVDEQRDNKVINNIVFLESEQETRVFMLHILHGLYTTGFYKCGVWLNTKETTEITLELNAGVHDTQKCGVVNELSSKMSKLENKLVRINITSVSSYDQTSLFELEDSFSRLFVGYIDVNDRLRFCELETMFDITVGRTAFISNYAGSNLVDWNLQFDGVVQTSNH